MPFFFFFWNRLPCASGCRTPCSTSVSTCVTNSTVANIVRIRLGISLSHNHGLSLRNVYCSVKYERAVVAPRCRWWASGSLFVVCVQMSGSRGQLVCRRSAEFLCQHPLERGRVYGRCGGSYSVARLLVARLLSWCSKHYLVRYHHSACVAAHLASV